MDNDSKVVSLAEHRFNISHNRGKARCMHCSHEWEAVVPIGVLECFECPSCHLMRGMFRYPFVKEGQQVWVCNCGNDLFHMTPNGMYCPNCGDWQTGWE